MPSFARSDKYKATFNEKISSLFKGNDKLFSVPNVCSFDSIHESWTFNFDTDDYIFTQRLKNLVNSLHRTQEID
jgi:hypothetical protein